VRKSAVKLTANSNQQQKTALAAFFTTSADFWLKSQKYDKY
jgi:hypothetical protein